MADEISIGKQAIKEVQDLRAELVKLSEDALKAGKNLSSISTPSGLNKSNETNRQIREELEKQAKVIQTLTDKITALTKKKEDENASVKKVLKGLEDETKNRQALQKQRERELALIDKNASLYNKTQQQINTLTKAYNDLAVKKERYNNLSANEEMRLKTLKSVTEKYNGVLKGTDANIGKYTRNVGNYASGYNALGNSINQLSREAPAFANSINTGFMAISNNIPALTDAIIGLRQQNALLKAEGKPTQSVLSQLAGSFFSLQTAISLGVTLLTIYGGKLVQMGIDAYNAKKPLSELEKTQMDIANAQERSVTASRNEITHLDVLINKYKDSNTSQKEKQIIIDELQSTYPKYFGNIDKETEKIIESGKAYKKLAADILQVATNKALEEDIVENATITRDKLKQIGGEILENNKTLAGMRKALGEGDTTFQDGLVFLTNKSQIEARIKTVALFNSNLEKERNKLIKSNENYADALAKSIKITESLNAKTENTKKEAKQAKRPEVQQLESFLQQGKPLIIEINEMMSRLSTERILASDEGRVEVDSMISKLSDLKTALSGGLPTAEGTILNPITTESIEKVKELSDAMKNYLKSFSSEFLQNSGLGSLEIFFDGTFKKLIEGAKETKTEWAVAFNAIAEVGQEVGNLLAKNSEANFASEKERLQSQYDVSLKYAGDNKAAQEKLAEDLEKNKKDIDYREAKAKQKQAIFNIAIDTAQAVMSAIAESPLTFGLPWSAIIAGMGLVQASMVASKEIPRYFMGGTHEGGLMMVNDGAGSNYRETIVTPDGNIMKPQGRNVVMNAPIGTEIFTHDQWDEQMNNMLKGGGINWNMPTQKYSGITKEEMEEAMVNAIGQQPQYHSNFDANGAATYISKRGNITRMNTNRSNGKGIKF